MNARDFKELYESFDEVNDSLIDVIDAVHDNLEDDRRYFYDVSGNGTEYICSGARQGVGFATCHLEIQPDGMAVAHVASVPIPAQLERDVAKLCRLWNNNFILEGLTVNDGRLCFETEPFDPTGDFMEAARATGLALSTIHSYTSAMLALEAGVDPWDLLDYDNDGDGNDGDDDGGDDDDSGGFSLDDLPSIDELRARILGDGPEMLSLD